jgi:hypothetical protein
MSFSSLLLSIVLAILALLVTIFQIKAKNNGVALCTALITIGNIISGGIQYNEGQKAAELNKKLIGTSEIPAIGCQLNDKFLDFYVVNADSSYILRNVSVKFDNTTNQIKGDINPNDKLKIKSIDTTYIYPTQDCSIIYGNTQIILTISISKKDGYFTIDTKYFDKKHEPFIPPFKNDTTGYRDRFLFLNYSAPVLYRAFTITDKKI